MVNRKLGKAGLLPRVSVIEISELHHMAAWLLAKCSAIRHKKVLTESWEGDPKGIRRRLPPDFLYIVFGVGP